MRNSLKQMFRFKDFKKPMRTNTITTIQAQGTNTYV